MVYGQFVVSNIRLVAPFQLGALGWYMILKLFVKGGWKWLTAFRLVTRDKNVTTVRGELRSKFSKIDNVNDFFCTKCVFRQFCAKQNMTFSYTQFFTTWCSSWPSNRANCRTRIFFKFKIMQLQGFWSPVHSITKTSVTQNILKW